MSWSSENVKVIHEIACLYEMSRSYENVKVLQKCQGLNKGQGLVQRTSWTHMKPYYIASLITLQIDLK